MKITIFEHYILLPKPDYFEYSFSKYFKPTGLSIRKNRSFMSAGIIQHNKYKSEGIYIKTRLDFNFKPYEIIISDKYAHERDKLVNKGGLNYPISDTDKYRKILIDQIEF